MGSQLENLLSNNSLDPDLDPALLGLLVDPSNQPASSLSPQQQQAPRGPSSPCAGATVNPTPMLAHGWQPQYLGQNAVIPFFGSPHDPALITPFVIPSRGLSGPYEGGLGGFPVSEPARGTGGAKGLPGQPTAYASPDLGPGGPYGGKTGGDDEKAASLLRRQAAIQAKNRRAQKRFRERQKVSLRPSRLGI